MVHVRVNITYSLSIYNMMYGKPEPLNIQHSNTQVIEVIFSCYMLHIIYVPVIIR